MVPIIVASPLLYRFLPLSDGTAHFFKVWLLRYELDNYGKTFDWNPFWYGGHPLFRFYPPVSYWITTALSYIIPLKLYQVFNSMIFTSYIILSLSTYYLSRTLKFSRLASLIIAMLVIVSPTFASFYSVLGAFPTIIAFSFVPLSLAFLVKGLDGKEIKYLLLASLVFSFIFLSHHLTAYLTILLFTTTFIFKTFQFRDFKKSVRCLAIFGGASFLLTSFWSIPLILEYSYSNFINRLTINPLDTLFTPLSRECIEYYCLFGVGPEFVIIGIIGAVLSFISVNSTKLRFHLEKRYFFILLLFLVTLLPLALAFLGIDKIISFGVDISYARFGLYLVLPLALLCGIVIEKFERHFKLLIIILLIFFVVFSNYAYISYTRNYERLSDTSVISYSERTQELYEFIKASDDGRMEIYGTFRPFASSVIPILTQKQVITGWYFESDLTYDTILSKIEDIDLGNAEFFDKISKEEYLGLLDEGFVRYIFINVCHPEGSKANEVLLNKFNVVYTHDSCFRILENNETYFTNPNLEWERISPEEIVVYNVPKTTLLVKESYYPHWRSYCGGKEFSILPDRFGMMVVNAENCGELHLKYEYPTFYKLLYFVSFIAVLMITLKIFKKHTHH